MKALPEFWGEKAGPLSSHSESVPDLSGEFPPLEVPQTHVEVAPGDGAGGDHGAMGEFKGLLQPL